MNNKVLFREQPDSRKDINDFFSKFETIILQSAGCGKTLADEDKSIAALRACPSQLLAICQSCQVLMSSGQGFSYFQVRNQIIQGTLDVQRRAEQREGCLYVIGCVALVAKKGFSKSANGANRDQSTDKENMKALSTKRRKGYRGAKFDLNKSYFAETGTEDDVKYAAKENQ